MIQPIPPVASSLAPPVDARPVSPASGSGVEVAAGPLAQPTQAGALEFGQALKGVDFQESQALRVPSSRQVWSHVNAKVTAAMDHLTAVDKSVMQSLHDFQDPPSGPTREAPAVGGGSEGAYEGARSEGAHADAGGVSAGLEDLMAHEKRALGLSLAMMGLTIETDMAKNASETVLSSLKQLTSGGG